MLRQIEGSRAVAETVALCRPEVICAYPISPQTRYGMCPDNAIIKLGPGQRFHIDLDA
jgi:pyruvate/2-oxoacid:ferredoxin oxidoreductase alpha subunit